MSGYGQEAQTELAPGWTAMGSTQPAVVDHLTPADPLAAARAQVAALETELRAVQQRFAAAKARLEALEVES